MTRNDLVRVLLRSTALVLGINCAAVPALANFVITQGSGTPVFSFDGSSTPIAGTGNCAGSVECTASVPITTAGSPLFVTGSAGLVTGTGGTFPATQSGAWNITNITGTVSLPTGAATSALQTTGNSALTTINTTLGTINTTLANPFQAGGSIGNTTFGSTQGTSPWVIGGPAAAGAVPVGNPVFTGMFDGTDIRRVMGDETNGLWVNIKAGATGGGAVTIANGADVVLGNNGDSANCASATSLIACVRQVNATLGSPLQAGGTVVATTTAQARAARNYFTCSVGTTSTTCLAAATATQFLQLQNISVSANIACTADGSAPVLNSNGLMLYLGQPVNWGPSTAGVPNRAINCIASVAASPLFGEWL
jgi:hypothetical protein